MICVDAYLFLVFSDLTCHLEDKAIGVFWFHCAALEEETELGSSYHEASPSAGKNTEIVFVLCRAWKCVPTANSGSVDISEVTGCHLLRRVTSQ